MANITATQYQFCALTWSPASATGAGATITDPNGGVTVVQASSASAQPNVWTIWYTPLLVGTYQIAWRNLDGSATGTDTLTVTARQDLALLDIDQCYLSLNMTRASGAASSARDADMLAYAAAATSAIEGIIGPILPRTITQTFDGGPSAVPLAARPTGILSVVENGSQIADFTLDREAALVRAGTTWWNRPFWPGFQNVTVTYTAGTGSPRPNELLAVRELFRHLWQIGRQGGRASLSDGVEDGVSVPSGFGIPNRVYELLSTSPSTPGFA